MIQQGTLLIETTNQGHSLDTSVTFPVQVKMDDGTVYKVDHVKQADLYEFGFNGYSPDRVYIEFDPQDQFCTIIPDSMIQVTVTKKGVEPTYQQLATALSSAEKSLRNILDNHPAFFPSKGIKANLTHEQTAWRQQVKKEHEEIAKLCKEYINKE